jgi:hypothetical protein
MLEEACADAVKDAVGAGGKHALLALTCTAALGSRVTAPYLNCAGLQCLLCAHSCIAQQTPADRTHALLHRTREDAAAQEGNHDIASSVARASVNELAQQYRNPDFVIAPS